MSRTRSYFPLFLTCTHTRTCTRTRTHIHTRTRTRTLLSPVLSLPLSLLQSNSFISLLTLLLFIETCPITYLTFYSA